MQHAVYCIKGLYVRRQYHSVLIIILALVLMQMIASGLPRGSKHLMERGVSTSLNTPTYRIMTKTESFSSSKMIAFASKCSLLIPWIWKFTVQKLLLLLNLIF